MVAGGHHGGAWKVAYADFVTAMMAFFLVMWLVAAATPEQRAAVFEYFKNPSMEKGVSPKAAPGQNGPGGASKSVVSLGGAMEAPRSSPDVQPMLGRPLEDINDSQREETPEEERARKMAEAQERRQRDHRVERWDVRSPIAELLLGSLPRNARVRL